MAKTTSAAYPQTIKYDYAVATAATGSLNDDTPTNMVTLLTARPVSESEPFELENGAILYAGYSQALSDGMVFHTISIEY